MIDAKGKTSEKGWTYERLGSHGNSKVVIRFTAPAEVKGVALLVLNYPDRASDQWMWTPAINRERRVAAQDRRARFFGTDFSFEDLEERDIEQYDYVLQGEDTIDKRALLEDCGHAEGRQAIAVQRVHLLGPQEHVYRRANRERRQTIA